MTHVGRCMYTVIFYREQLLFKYKEFSCHGTAVSDINKEGELVDF